MKSELNKDIEKLFADSKNISGNVYTSNQIKDLPLPVQRYFKYSLKENQPYVSYARLQHGGEFKARKAPFGCKSVVALAKHWVVPIG